MFELIVILSRYLFVLYMLIFVWNGYVFLMFERGSYVSNPHRALSRQRIMIFLFHLTSILILAYLPNTFTFDMHTLLFGTVILILLALAFFLSTKVFKTTCPVIWNCVGFLLNIGLVMLYRLDSELAYKQLLWVLLGFAVALIIPIVLNFLGDLEKYRYVYLIASYVLLLSPLILGEELFGANNWIQIGSFSFQPSEAVKILYIFYLAATLSKKAGFKELIITGLSVAPLVLILVYQRDLGGALIFSIMFILIYYIASGSELIFLSSLAIGSLMAFIAAKMFSHVQVRVAAWQNPLSMIDEGGFQILQSLFAIGTWGATGSGLTRGYPKYIPVVERDFIYAAICEEFGVIFGIAMIGIIVLILMKGLIIAVRSNSKFFSIISSGLIIIITFQSFLIMAGVTKFIPMTGVTLPFVCYGGSSMLISIVMIVLVQWIYSNHYQNEEV